ncbi:MAG: hypothetical protein ACMXYL_05595 [Candidatus Woesearchaeota archaeon]
MYFWHNESLALELRKGLDEHSRFRYFLLVVAFYYVLFELISSNGSGTVFNPLAGIVGIGIIVIGIYNSFMKNMAGDGNDFIGRFMCLAWPITVKSFVFTTLIMILLLLGLYRNLDYNIILDYSFVFGLLFLLSFFYHMYIGIRIASTVVKKKKSGKKKSPKK